MCNLNVIKVVQPSSIWLWYSPTSVFFRGQILVEGSVKHLIKNKKHTFLGFNALLEGFKHTFWLTWMGCPLRRALVCLRYIQVCSALTIPLFSLFSSAPRFSAFSTPKISLLVWMTNIFAILYHFQHFCAQITPFWSDFISQLPNFVTKFSFLDLQFLRKFQFPMPYLWKPM